MPLNEHRKAKSPEDLDQALLQCEERMASMLALSSDWYWEQDENCRFTVVVGTAAEQTGPELGQYLGTARWDHGAVPVGDGGSWDKHKAVIEARQPFANFVFKRPNPRGELRYISTTGQPATQASLAVVVTPQTAPSDGSADQLAQVLPPLVQELAAKSGAAVVVGSSGGSGAGSPIAVLRSNNVSGQVSTVDDADLAAGQTVAMQALAVELADGKAGSYGFTANGATAIAPSPATTRPACCASAKPGACRSLRSSNSSSGRADSSTAPVPD